MNDIELLRDFRSEVAPDTTAAKARGRLLLEERMQRQPRHARRRWLMLGGVPATAAALVLATVIALNPFGGPSSPTNAAAAELHAMALIAAERADASTPLLAGQYAYTQTEARIANTADTRDGRAATMIIPVLRETWLGADGSGRLRETVNGEPLWLTEPDAELGAVFLQFAERDETFGPGEYVSAEEVFALTPDQMRELAADPTALEELIVSYAEMSGNPRDYASFVVVGDLLRDPRLLPEFRAAVFKFAAGIPRVQLIGEVTDSAGRPGVAVAMAHAGVRHELVLDPGTTHLLEERDVLVSSGERYEYVVEPGTALSRTTYDLVTGIVSSTETTP